ncbi:CLUMA_CG005976, isoform A [Clunio marinus]|uniref:CLUMA_CG005976, isoform A n=1 Tax=Clunio marinus TaxID=568069 RepID=A0A1J1HXY0_9DIPT|nr:CLUMA_CG005976, isoform A [Clunio marinus]
MFRIMRMIFGVEINELKNKIENTLGSVDILVNNAGLLSLSTSLQEGTPEAIQNVVNVNLTSHFWTCRTFLNGMIKRKQGHVVAISSFAGKLTIPCSIAYCATKFGVSGFMDALFDELCLLEQDFVKTTTVYPLFINTRKELGDFLKNNKLLPRLEPDHAAHLIVKGILRNQRNIYIPKAAKRSLILNFFPDRIIRYVKVNSTDNSKIKKERLRMQAEILV